MNAVKQKISKIGLCKLCRNQWELCKSHAIPDAHFKQIIRRSAGKAVSITDDECTPNQYTHDGWQTYMLCKDCENLFNKTYDEYGINLLRDLKNDATYGSDGLTFKNIDRKKLRMFLLSILWRISESNHSMYR